MNESVALTFYVHSTQGAEKPKSGWQRYMIYDGRRMVLDLGCGGSMQFIKLSDGRIIATNDLWADNFSHDGWSSCVPNGTITGVMLHTRMCRPKSRKVLKLIISMIDGRYLPHQICLKSGLSDREAYECVQSGGRSNQIPESKRREYRPIRSPGEVGLAYASFASPEGAVLTHIKVGSSKLQPLKQKEQLEGLDPSTTPVYIFYKDDERAGTALNEGDVIDKCYVYDKPGW